MKNRLKQLRTEKGMKQEELARILNVDKSQISRYESCKQDISTDFLVKLSKIFNCSVNYILYVNEFSEDNYKDIQDLKEYETAVKVAKESNITPKELIEQILLLRSIYDKKD